MTLPVLQPAPPEPSGSSLDELAPPARLVAWALDRFDPARTIVTTSFGMEGCALIDMIARTGRSCEITYLDTHFFFPETHELCERLAARYPRLVFVNRGTPVTPAEQAEVHGPRLWERDPDACCRLRKVAPLRRTLAGADVWISAVRRDQSLARHGVRVAEWDWRFDVLKISPLAHWSRRDVWAYVRTHGAPYNELHERGYSTIGCTHCTAPTRGARPLDYTREGRWRGSTKTECGLHEPRETSP